ncbi:MAG: glycosyltransferase [Candidatus Schekmanbacteria bacterium]|nr:glycosyltransferase [Candidatus Schekmanbacteria bacterium]
MSSATNPKVSVLMSVYNGERFLRDSIESILKQTFQNFEFLIVNDGSTDRSREIILSYLNQRIKLIDNGQNIGLTRALNKGLSLAKGEYIARMDADDLSLPARLEKQAAFLDAHPETGVLGINNWIIDERGDEVRKDNRLIGHEEIMAGLLSENRFVHSSLMFRKKFLDMQGYYAEHYPYAQDYELILRLSEVCKLANLPEYLHKWRENYSTGITVLKRPEQIMVRDKIRREFLEKHFSPGEEFIKSILGNLQNNPKDKLLLEYLLRIFNQPPFSPDHFLLKLKMLYYLVRGWF